MKYENMPCPVCGSHMHEGDDIVVCPDCGTPCHRKCWAETGHCINESKHGTDFKFMPSGTGSISGGIAADTDRQEEIHEDTVICHICGSENPVTSINCNHCGALLIKTENGETVCPICKEKIQEGSAICPNCGASLLPKSAVPFRPYTPFNGDDPDEKIGENTAGDIGTYVRINQRKYINKFHNIENGGKISFNWAAFFFGPFWFLFRKMFLYGTILMMVFACVSLITAPSSEKALEIFNEYSPKISEYNSILNGSSETSSSASAETQPVATGRAEIGYGIEVTTAAEGSSSVTNTTASEAEETTAESTTAAAEESTTEAETTASITREEAAQKSYSLQLEMYRKMLSVMKKPMLLTLAIYFIINLLSAFYADGLYYRKIKKDLEAIKNDVPDSNVRTMLISRRGGISVLNVICGWFVFSLFSDVAVTIAEYVADMF